MINLQNTSSTKSRVLSEVELTQVVGGSGHNRHCDRSHGLSNQSRNGQQRNGRGPQVLIFVNIDRRTINNTIINNTTFL